MPQFTVEATKGGKPVTLRITAESEQAAAEKAMLTGHGVLSVEYYDPDVQIVTPASGHPPTVKAADTTAAVDDQSVLMVKLAALPGLQQKYQKHKNLASRYLTAAIVGSFITFAFGFSFGLCGFGENATGLAILTALIMTGLFFGYCIMQFREEDRAADKAREAIENLKLPDIYTPAAPRPK